MKKLVSVLALCTMLSLVTGTVFGAPQSRSKNEKPTKFDISRAKELTVTGYIGDALCGLGHASSMGDAKACTLKCVDGGSKFILADRDKKIVYALVKEDSQKKARPFAGQKVKLTGQVDSKARAIHVIKIESAS